MTPREKANLIVQGDWGNLYDVLEAACKVDEALAQQAEKDRKEGTSSIPLDLAIELSELIRNIKAAEVASGG